MSLAQRVEGVIANYLGEKDEHAVITEAVAPPMVRFDPSTSGANPKFLAHWAKVDLSHVCGFPMWEADVFGLLSAAYDELNSIFNHYAKSGSAGAVSANAGDPAGRMAPGPPAGRSADRWPGSPGRCRWCDTDTARAPTYSCLRCWRSGFCENCRAPHRHRCAQYVPQPERAHWVPEVLLGEQSACMATAAQSSRQLPLLPALCQVLVQVLTELL